MMYVDTGLRLATAEVVPNAGAAPGGLGEDSVNLALDPSGLTSKFRSFVDIGAGQRLLLNFQVDAEYTCGTFNASLEFQLVSLPIAATLLSDGSGGAADGKRTHIAGVVTTDATDDFTVVGHGLPLGTPVYLSALATTTGVVTNTIYYVVPTSADRFRLAISLANALAGTLITLGTGNGTATVEFIPTVHASSGSLSLFSAGDPTNQGPLRLGTRFQVPVRPLANMTPQQAVPTSQTVSQPLGAGPELGLIAANAQRFYYLRYIPSATITAGAVTCDLLLDAGDSLKYYPIGAETVG